MVGKMLIKTMIFTSKKDVNKIIEIKKNKIDKKGFSVGH